MEQLANNPTSTLSGGISSGATSLSVASATPFPTTGNFVIKIDGELLVVTNVSGTTFTVTRGQDGTSATSHSSGATVTQVVSKKVLENLYAELYQVGTVASRPTTVRGGTVYYGTDLDVEWYYNGSAWDLVWPNYVPNANKVNISGWTALNLGSDTWTDYNGVYSVMQAAATGIRGHYHTIPSAPFNAYAVMGLNGVVDGNNRAGILLYDSGTTKCKMLTILQDQYSVVQTANTPSSAISSGSGFFISFMKTIYVRFQDDNTNWLYHYSVDGTNWINFFKETRNTFLTPTHIGLFTTNGTAAVHARNFYGYWEA